jgi:hypothetical protein
MQKGFGFITKAVEDFARKIRADASCFKITWK